MVVKLIHSVRHRATINNRYLFWASRIVSTFCLEIIIRAVTHTQRITSEALIGSNVIYSLGECWWNRGKLVKTIKGDTIINAADGIQIVLFGGRLGCPYAQ